VRTALGAARNRLIRQLVAESVSLWALASVAGLGFAYGSIRLLLVYGPRTIPRLGEAGLDLIAIGVAFAVGLIVVLACGTIPAILATKERRREQHHRLQDLLASAQIAGTLVLFVGAVLFAQSFLRAQSKDPGYPAQNMLIVRIDLPRPTYPDRAAVERFFSNVRERVRSLPGVVDVGGITDFFIRRNAGQWVTVKDRMIQKDSNSRLAIEGVTPGYFKAMGIDIIEGRDFEPGDYETGAPGVFIVSETLARRFWPGESAVGKSLVTGEAPPRDGKWATVVGVTRDIRREALDVEPIMLGFEPSFLRGMDMTIRVSGSVDNLIAAIRPEIRAVDSGLPVMSVIPASSRLAERLGERRFETQVLSVFAVIALLLSAAGIYGLLAYQVTLRSREIGIRSALGAHRRTIVRMIVGKGLRLAIFGTIAGLIGAAAAAKVVQSLLYETSANDATTYIAAAVFILLIALIASWLPANRAARLDPLHVLRS
jgi:putative ABC transport system permease protein